MSLAAMDALSSSLFISRIPDGNMSNTVVQLPLLAVKPSNNRAGTLKINQSFNLSLWVSSSKRIGAAGSRILAVSKDISGEGTENPGSNNGHISVFEDIVSVGEAPSSPKQSSTTTFGDASKVVTPLTAGSGSGTGGGTRAGPFRTPISGGVQSATSTHGLPRPALAVRNLMEQDSWIPGWSGLSNARVTIFGDVFPLPEDQQEWAHKQYIKSINKGLLNSGETSIILGCKT